MTVQMNSRFTLRGNATKTHLIAKKQSGSNALLIAHAVIHFLFAKLS